MSAPTIRDLARAVHSALDLPRPADSRGRRMRLEQLASRVAGVKGAMNFLAKCGEVSENDLRITVEALAAEADEELLYQPGEGRS
jgi:hypothetical protein